MSRDFTPIPEQMPATGGAYASQLADSAKSLKINDIELLFREAVQNSHDQRNSPREPIDFSINIRKLTLAQRSILASALPNSTESSHLEMLRKLLRGPKPIYILCFTDSNTKGLNGPPGANVASSEKNFANFFHKVGRDSASDSDAGGAFGHGRAVFFNSSAVSTALAFTRFKHSSATVSRFYGMTLGNDFEDGERVYTGKWLWGRRNRSMADPIEGAKASKLARDLGIYEKLVNTTGTAICILCPKYIETDDDALKYAKALEYSAHKSIWPHLMEGSKKTKSINVKIEIEGHSPIIPNVENSSSPAFKYVSAYRESHSPENSSLLQTIRMTNKVDVKVGEKLIHISPIDALGNLYWTQELQLRSLSLNQTSNSDTSKTDGLIGIPDNFPPLQGIALFRSPKLVVDYLPPPVQFIEHSIFGYFESSKEANPFFRLSEEDTHDAWKEDRLQAKIGRGRPNPVRRLYGAIESDFKLKLSPARTGESTAEAALMDDFGAFLSFAGTGSRGPKNTKPPGPPPPAFKTTRPYLVTPTSLSAKLVSYEGQYVVCDFEFVIERIQKFHPVKELYFEFMPRVLLADGLENDETETKPEENPLLIQLQIDGITISGNQVTLKTISRAVAVTVRVRSPRSLNIACAYKEIIVEGDHENFA